MNADNDIDILDQEDDVDMELLASSDHEDTKEEETLTEEVVIKDEKLDNLMKNDETVPKGWTYRGEGLHMILKAPNGVFFRSRRTAMEEMIKCGKFSMLEIIDMKSKLLFEGWNTSEKLPRGWMMKKKGRKTYFLGQGGEFFENISKARFFLSRYREYFSDEDMQRIEHFANRNEMEGNDGADSWVYDSQTVPEGWGIKEVMFGIRKIKKVKDPYGNVHNSRRVALKYLIDKKYPEKMIESIRKCLQYDGWKCDENLPKNWFYKIPKGSLWFLTSVGQLLTTQEAVYKYLRKENLNDEFEKMKNFVIPKIKMLDQSGNEEKTEKIHGYIKNHPSLPYGWSGKDKLFGKVKILELLSPDGKVFTGKRSALAHMVKENYPSDQIDEMRHSLELDGWMKHENLPINWLFKKWQGYSSTIFVSPNGLFFKKKEKALSHLENHSRFDDAKLLRAFHFKPATNEPTKFKTSEDTLLECEESYIHDWKYKNVTYGKTPGKLYFSPSGFPIKGKRSLLKYMLEKHFPEEKIEALRNSLKEDGWSQHARLPKNWFYRHQGRLHFLSSSGNFYKSKEVALKYLRLSSATQNEYEMLKSFSL